MLFVVFCRLELCTVYWRNMSTNLQINFCYIRVWDDLEMWRIITCCELLISWWVFSINFKCKRSLTFNAFWDLKLPWESQECLTFQYYSNHDRKDKLKRNGFVKFECFSKEFCLSFTSLKCRFHCCFFRQVGTLS